MKTGIMAICALLCAAAALAQTGGVISGTIVASQGDAALPKAPVHLKNGHRNYPSGRRCVGADFAKLIAPQPAPTGPAPRTREGKPDLSGVWLPAIARDPGQTEPLPTYRMLHGTGNTGRHVRYSFWYNSSAYHEDRHFGGKRPS